MRPAPVRRACAEPGRRRHRLSCTTPRGVGTSGTAGPAIPLGPVIPAPDRRPGTSGGPRAFGAGPEGCRNELCATSQTTCRPRHGYGHQNRAPSPEPCRPGSESAREGPRPPGHRHASVELLYTRCENGRPVPVRVHGNGSRHHLRPSAALDPAPGAGTRPSGPNAGPSGRAIRQLRVREHTGEPPGVPAAGSRSPGAGAAFARRGPHALRFTSRSSGHGTVLAFIISTGTAGVPARTASDARLREAGRPGRADPPGPSSGSGFRVPIRSAVASVPVRRSSLWPTSWPPGPGPGAPRRSQG